jgi:hypothetical protein
MSFWGMYFNQFPVTETNGCHPFMLYSIFLTCLAALKSWGNRLIRNRIFPSFFVCLFVVKFGMLILRWGFNWFGRWMLFLMFYVLICYLGIEVKPGKPYPYHSDDVQGNLRVTQVCMTRPIHSIIISELWKFKWQGDSEFAYIFIFWGLH